jgi:hypothetical protein
MDYVSSLVPPMNGPGIAPMNQPVLGWLVNGQGHGKHLCDSRLSAGPATGWPHGLFGWRSWSVYCEPSMTGYGFGHGYSYLYLSYG